MESLRMLERLAEKIEEGKTCEALIELHRWNFGVLPGCGAPRKMTCEKCIGGALGLIGAKIEEEFSVRLARSEEDRKAIAWVRENGGFEEVEGYYECGRRIEPWNEQKADLYELMNECGGVEEIKKRLMPAGMEWPRFEDGEPVRIGDEFQDGNGNTRKCTSIEFETEAEGVLDALLHWGGEDPDCWMLVCLWQGESVKRPAKVLDADGVEIREKRDVWWICEGDERGIHAERLRVETILPDGLVECSPYNGGTWVYLEPSELYVSKHAIAADGKPLREGETVWSLVNGELFIVASIDYGRGWTYVSKSGKDEDSFPILNSCSKLTHERPESWERLEDDATRPPRDYCGMLLHWAVVPEYDDAHYIEGMASDLVRRAKKLAGVEA